MSHPDESSLKTVPATAAKQSFGRLLDDAQREPVVIERNGRPVAVVLSVAEYELFERLEDAHWGKRAEAALDRRSAKGQNFGRRPSPSGRYRLMLVADHD